VYEESGNAEDRSPRRAGIREPVVTLQACTYAKAAVLTLSLSPPEQKTTETPIEIPTHATVGTARAQTDVMQDKVNSHKNREVAVFIYEDLSGYKDGNEHFQDSGYENGSLSGG